MQSDVLNPVIGPAAGLRLRSFWQRWLAGWRRMTAQLKVRRAPRRLCLCETVSLGEKRFVAVVRFERHQFLVGGTANSIVLLARLGQARLPRVRDEHGDSSC
jgi:flagellar biogenesis protein FliO